MQAILSSPHFLFRVEIDQEPDDPRPPTPSTTGSWPPGCRTSSGAACPTTSCSTTARQGDLRQPDVLEAQVRRMLKDPKSHALVENFADQWLQSATSKSIHARPDHVPARSTNAAVGHAQGDGVILRERRCARTAASSTLSTPITPSSTNGWRSTTASTASRATTSAR